MNNVQVRILSEVFRSPGMTDLVVDTADQGRAHIRSFVFFATTTTSGLRHGAGRKLACCVRRLMQAGGVSIRAG